MIMHIGTVYIVGAGPGNPEYITVRGLACLRDADVVLHDRLIHPRLLEEARSDASIIYVGKEYGSEDTQQERIHALMIEAAHQGRSVCRLKGGDPFVFGRGGEEILALTRAGIPYEVVPGISSAIAVPASAGIPLTHREYAHSFMVIAGSRSHDLQSKEWSAARALVRAGGTVVVLMGFSRLHEIIDHFLLHTCSSTTPVAVISKGTYVSQDCRTGTLADILQNIAGLNSPAVIVIGSVVAFRQDVAWAEITADLTADPDFNHTVPAFQAPRCRP